MTEPIKNVTLGGLTYNENIAKGRETEKGKFEITFKSGEKLTYPKQSERTIKVEPDNAEFYVIGDGESVECGHVIIRCTFH